MAKTVRNREHGSKKDKSGSEKGMVTAIVLIAGIAAALYHFRGTTASFVLPRLLSPTVDSKTPGGDFEMLGWANWLEKVGSGKDVARCCYNVDFKDMYKSWCQGELSMIEDSIRLLSACSENLRGRTENPITGFHTDYYEGAVTQSRYSADQPVFLVTELKRRYLHKKDFGSASPSGKAACKILEKCAGDKTKSEKPCREVRKLMGDCSSK
mmetsp:Transcript_10931/g.26813  ORF Transcript_10931/g.26813 Transcript_10931/m.26813 type:complete len:211 (-) Transcript_10931:128-760(-)|eukprot:CAMPEP_0178987668 /NCGR_PEP_ID=MMETSP0795-20121207/3390_1 /TAXON_ID=88552 /ORGANISM="Amoebophrya sp., Strain Ameob2" /LENGTH=210 /DNA_ID=CAMNT_0020678871 /DNA_START=322 /DNA_END=954 /DNA_ORIENTATION=-